MAVKYGSYTSTKTASIPFAFGFNVETRGDGTGVLAFNTRSTQITTFKTTGNVKMYTQPDGVTGECTSLTVPANVDGRIWIKCTTGSGKIYSSSKIQNSLSFTSVGSSINAPKLSGNISDYTPLKTIFIGYRCNIPFNAEKLTNIEYVTNSSKNNEGNVTVNATVLTECTNFSFVNIRPENGGVAGGRIYVTGDLSKVATHCTLEVVNERPGDYTLTGDITAIDPSWFYGEGGYDNISANISGWTNCFYIENNCPNVTMTTVIGMDRLGYLHLSEIIVSTVVVNQVAQDLLANVNVVKGYAATEVNRIFDLAFAEGTGAPTGVGLAAVNDLRSWVGGLGQRNTVTTR